MDKEQLKSFLFRIRKFVKIRYNKEKGTIVFLGEYEKKLATIVELGSSEKAHDLIQKICSLLGAQVSIQYNDYKLCIYEADMNLAKILVQNTVDMRKVAEYGLSKISKN